MHPLHPLLLLGCREGLGKSSCGSCDSLDHVLWEWRFGRSLPTLWKLRLEKLQESSLPGEAVPLGRQRRPDRRLKPPPCRPHAAPSEAGRAQGPAAVRRCPTPAGRGGSTVGEQGGCGNQCSTARPDSHCQGKGKLQNKKSLTPSPALAQRPPTPGEGPQCTAGPGACGPGACARTQSLSAEGRSPEVQ